MECLEKAHCAHLPMYLQAKEIMDTQKGYVILDTRTQEEYDEGHIPGAILIPYDEVMQKAEAVLPDKGQLILVYCRSGNRSKQASEKLAAQGILIPNVLQNNDAYNALIKIDGLVFTGPTGTNVNDVAVALLRGAK